MASFTLSGFTQRVNHDELFPRVSDEQFQGEFLMLLLDLLLRGALVEEDVRSLSAWRNFASTRLINIHNLIRIVNVGFQRR